MYLRKVDQTKEEIIAMYMRCTKEELASMLYECNRILDARPVTWKYADNSNYQPKPIEKYISHPTNPTC